MNQSDQRLWHPFADMSRVPARELVLRSLVGQSVQISPPFVISEDELDLLTERIGGALERLSAEAGVAP